MKEKKEGEEDIEKRSPKKEKKREKKTLQKYKKSPKNDLTMKYYNALKTFTHCQFRFLVSHEAFTII